MSELYINVDNITYLKGLVVSLALYALRQSELDLTAKKLK